MIHQFSGQAESMLCRNVSHLGIQLLSPPSAIVVPYKIFLSRNLFP